MKEEGSRIVIGYDLKKVTGKNMYEWYEVYIPKKEKSFISYQDVEDAILNDINAQTDYKILTGFVWTPEGGEPINVWLSAENQHNYSEAERKAKDNPTYLPIVFKLGENENKEAVYHTFTTYEELSGFYDSTFLYINQCLNEGWQRKDAIDWTPYKALFPTPEPTPSEE